VQTGKLSSTLSADSEYACRSAIAALEEMTAVLKEKMPADGTAAFKLLKTEFDKRTKALKKQAEGAGKQLSNVFIFCEEVFSEGQEMLILVTELTISYYGAHFISRYGCKEYFSHNKELLFYERQKEIIRELESLDLEE
ncbi:MAG: ATPase, partial [Clostridia bacterium]|nr:ATPase [Clostridia bacterium]